MALQADLWYNETRNIVVLGDDMNISKPVINLLWRSTTMDSLYHHAHEGNFPKQLPLFQTWKLYGLRHPLTQEVRYVGITRQPLDQRLKQHLADHYRNKQRWFNELARHGLLPEIVGIVDLGTFNKYEAECMEADYIQRLTNSGCNLINFRREVHVT